jgi:hypothetical protein
VRKIRKAAKITRAKMTSQVLVLPIIYTSGIQKTEDRNQDESGDVLVVF